MFLPACRFCRASLTEPCLPVRRCLCAVTWGQKCDLMERYLALTFCAAFRRWAAEVAINGHARLPPRADPAARRATKLARAMARKAAADAEAATVAAASPGSPSSRGKRLTAGAGAGTGAGASVSAKAVAPSALATLSGGFDPARRLHRTKMPASRVKQATGAITAAGEGRVDGGPSEASAGAAGDEGDESEYDDDDVLGAACGLRAAGDGKFDVGLVFRMLDRDKDGVVSIRDWGVATGSGPGLGARMTNKQVRGH